MHTFQTNTAGELEHIIDGALRATVPPEGFDAYQQQYPACASLVTSARADALQRAAIEAQKRDSEAAAAAAALQRKIDAAVSQALLTRPGQ